MFEVKDEAAGEILGAEKTKDEMQYFCYNPYILRK